MNLDLETLRHEFPVTRQWIYCNHAAVAPISTRVARAIQGVLTDLNEYGAVHWASWGKTVGHARESAARLINGNPDEIAFAKNTSDGLSILSNGLDWKWGDRVVSIDTEFPANVYPWLALKQRGVELVTVPEREGRVDLGDVERALEVRTRVLTVSYVQYLSGFRIDLDALGEMCRRRGIIFCVDAIQGMGAFEIDVKRQNIDFLSADAHKWMLATEGIAVAYVSKRILDRVTPAVLGWMSVEHFNDFNKRELNYRHGALRYECGSLNTIGIYGLAAALDLLHEVGIENISRQILETTSHLYEGLCSKGYAVLGSRIEGEASGIVSFRSNLRGHDTRTVFRRLEEARVATALRGGYIRVAPHFYNTREEMDHLLSVLP
ncbi:MAG: aminotransferase class V-fold PLP-dependent enzyme [Terriglobia bacterium]